MLLPATVPLRRSRFLAVALAAAHLVVAAGLVPTVLPVIGKLACWLGLALSLAWTLRRPEVVALSLGADGRIALVRRDGDAFEGTVHPATTVSTILVVLVVAIDGRLRTLALPPDALGADRHRQLRLWLRWKAGSSAA